MLPFSEACERNKAPILDGLCVALAQRHAVLEIGSGTGQHAVHFAAHLPHLIWQPSEVPENLPALAERIAFEGGSNLLAPVILNVLQPWPRINADAVFTANTLHIMSWSAVQALFEGLGSLLDGGGTVCVYGPFRYAGSYNAQSNAEFDHMLRSRDPHSGVRDIEAVATLAQRAGFTLTADKSLPANNQLLTFERASTSPERYSTASG